MLPHAIQSPVQNLLNYTIFKALGKKGGPRKQVHLWQLSKAFQLQYYLVKILQNNVFFYAVDFLKFCETLKEKITALYMELQKDYHTSVKPYSCSTTYKKSSLGNNPRGKREVHVRCFFRHKMLKWAQICIFFSDKNEWIVFSNAVSNEYLSPL